MRLAWISGVALASVALLTPACGDDVPDPSGDGSTGPTTGPDDTGPSDGTATDTGTADDTAGEVVPIDVEPGCDPLVPSVCAFPFPSMAHLEADDTTETGFRIAMPAEVLPPNVTDPELFMAWLAEADGFSRAVSFSALFPDAELDTSNFTDPFDLAPSLEVSAPVQVFDLATGARIPVWIELERRGQTPDEQALIIRPMTGLPFGGRVAIVVTDTLRYTDGSVPEASPAFAALRDGQSTDADVVESRRADFETMFETVGAAGVPRESIILAWQTVIASEAVAQEPLPAVIAAATAAIEGEAPSYTITQCKSDEQADADDHGCTLPGGLADETWRRLFGTVDLPNYIGDDGRIRLDDDGNAIQNGTFEADFVVNIPDSLKDAPAGSGMIVNFGHGLLVEPATYLDDDGNSNGQVVLSNEMGAVFIGTRWSGLSSTEAIAAAALVQDFSTAAELHDLLVQGVANQVLMVPFMRDTLANDPLLALPDGSATIINPDEVGYTGISQGGIMGTTLLAVSPYVQSGVLHVPSAGYAHLLPHSADFGLFQNLVDGAVPDLNDQQVFFAVGQRLFDGGDPINFVQDLVDEPATDLGPKHALWQCAIGDTVAPWYGCDMMVRTGGFAQVAPAVREVYGIETVEAPTGPGSSALHYYDPQLGDPQLRTDAPEDVGAHGSIRRNEEVHRQIIDFLDPDAPGTIVNHCGGACVVDPAPTG